MFVQNKNDNVYILVLRTYSACRVRSKWCTEIFLDHGSNLSLLSDFSIDKMSTASIESERFHTLASNRAPRVE